MTEIKNNKAANLVQEIGDKIIEKLNEIDDNYEYEADEYGFSSASCRCSFNFEYGNSQCDVDCSVSWESGTRKKCLIECEVEGVEGIHKGVFKKLERIEKYVQEYVEENLDRDALLESIQEDMEDSYYDEWDDHGFRDEADYIHWRYG